MNRRTFLKAGTLAACAAFADSRTAVAADTEIEILTAEPGALISPHIYGHFIEHLGGVIYDGVWVGRDSKIPNVDGIRKQFVDDMKRIGAPNLRWPGGCFADGYHWRDGIGKSRARPRTYNFWQSRMPAGLDATESNQFGIHEFMHLCRLVGAEPYVAANVGSGTPRNSTIGFRTATRLREPSASPTSAPPTATKTHSEFATGASVMSPGDAAEPCGPKNTPLNTVSL